MPLPKPAIFITTQSDSPVDATGPALQHPHSRGHYLATHIVLPDDLEAQGVQVDSLEEAEKYRRELMEDEKGLHMDPRTIALNRVVGRPIPMPPAHKFIDVRGSSPWYRVKDVQIELGEFVEAPWIALEFLYSGTQIAPKEEEIRVSS